MLKALATLLLAFGTATAQQLPAGTVLPVFLSSTLDVRHAKAGDLISGKIMQDVLIPDGMRILRGTKIAGRILKAQPALAGSPSQLILEFDYLEANHRRIPIETTARAVASMTEVYEARIPTNAWADYGTSPSDWNTVQIGGAGVYRGNGEVVQGNQIVGRATDYGAVTAKLIAAPERGCPNKSEGEEALWKFSPWACGAYGFRDLGIVRSPGTSTSEIVLQSGHNIRIQGGSGWLLRVITPAEAAP